MKALLLKAVEALKQGLRIEELGRREDVHWESLRDMRRAFHDQQLAAIADLEAAIREQPGEAVAWLYEATDGGRLLAFAPNPNSAGTWHPLYAVAPMKDEGEARQVCYEAYQVVGSLLSDLGKFDTPEAEKILDNLSQARMVHDDVLPWASYESALSGKAQP